MEEKTKDYSKVYLEETPPPPQTRRTITKNLDGAHIYRRHREAGIGIDPNDLTSALYNLSAAQHKAYAINTLQQHYSAVFQKKNKQTYKVYMNYIDEGFKKETYLVRIDRNTLRDVKNKLPIKGDYRLFFTHNGNECEEVEDDDATLPYVEKDGAFVIYCRLFPK